MDKTVEMEMKLTIARRDLKKLLASELITATMIKGSLAKHIGLVLAVDPADVDTVMAAVKAAGETPYVIGSIEAGEKGVTLC